jgi:antitoxin ParD1/3/4
MNISYYASVEEFGMAGVERRTFSLSPEQARYIDAQVAAGAYASGSEVVRAGLRSLQERHAVLERWLREEVLPTIHRMEADPSRGIPADRVLENIRAHHAKRKRAVRK